jgi:hypothetical protein
MGAERGEAVRVQARCISSRGHFKAWPRTSGPLSPYTLRKYGAGGGDLAHHGRDRIDQCRDLSMGGVPATGGGEEAAAPLSYGPPEG